MTQIKPFEINEIFVPALQTDKRYIILYGGRGSGKSYFASEFCIMKLLAKPNITILVLRKVKETIKYSFFTDLMKVVKDNDLELQFEYSVARIKIRCVRTGSEIIFMGLDDPAKVKSTSSIDFIVIEEALELDEEDFIQVSLLLGRDKNIKNPQMMLLLNPEGETHWINQYFFVLNKYEGDTLIIHSNMNDNDFVSEDWKQNLLNTVGQDDYYQKVWIEGIWASRTTTAVFTNWKIDTEVSDNYSDYNNAMSGLDFGFTHSQVFLSLALVGDNIIIFDEIYQKHQTRDQLFEAVKNKPLPIIADSEDPRMITEMRSMGINVTGAVKGRGSVKEGVDFLKRYNIKIHPKCVNTIKEFGAFSYFKDKKSGQILNEFVQINDDCIAAARYATEQYRNELYSRNSVDVDINPYFVIHKRQKQSEHHF